DQPALVRNISQSLGIPYHFLNKVLQTLTRENIVVSHKGTHGGFALGRSSNEIRLTDIVRAVDGEKFLDECVLGFPACSEENPCPVHPQWKRAKKTILEILHVKTVAALSKDLDGKLEFLETLRKQQH
ncbi:MAG: Rrf2 family transcriptional regulator, partial [Bacteroidota bacterium]